MDTRGANTERTPVEIAVIEDDEALLSLIRKSLSRGGFQVKGITTGAEAIDWITCNQPELLLIDYNLPDMTGKQLIRTLIKQQRKIPFIVATGQGDEKTAVDMMKLGARDYLVKDAMFLSMLPKVVTSVVEQIATEKKLIEAEEALRFSSAAFKSIQESVIATDTEYVITHWNEVSERQYGIKASEAIGKKLLDIIDIVESGSGEKQGWLDKLEDEGCFQSEQLHRTPYAEVWVNICVQAIEDENKRYGWVLLSNDITGSKRYQEKLEHAASEWRRTFDSVTNLISIHDNDFRITRVNMAFANAVHMTPKELLGKNCYEVVHGTDGPIAGCPCNITRQSEKPAITEFFEPYLDSYLQVSSAPVFNEQGKVVSCVHVASDITERKMMEAKLQERNEQLDSQNVRLKNQAREMAVQHQELVRKSRELEKASRAKSEFLATMSHELRTPLNAIIGFSELLLDGIPGDINDKQVECLQDIMNSGHHLKHLIDDILDLAKVESRKMEFNIRAINISEAVSEAVQSIKSIMDKKNHRIRIKIDDELPQVFADKRRLRQVLVNLLSNAVKFTPAGGALAIEAFENGNWCQVSVIDSGIGIKRGDIKRIFQSFIQAETVPDEKKEGTGLGLALTKQLIAQMGGKIWVESQVRKGSRFNFTLPLAGKDEGEQEQNQKQEVKTSESLHTL